MIKFEYEGREFEFRGEYDVPHLGDHYLGHFGDVMMARVEHTTFDAPRAIVHPVEEYHDFGGIRFRETGEVRGAEKGEWYLYSADDWVYFANQRVSYAYRILEPVSIL